jgi:putative transposon-encoded protein
MSKNQTLDKKPITITIQGYEVVEKTAKPCATSARIIVPKDWIGKKVKIIRLDP